MLLPAPLTPAFASDQVVLQRWAGFLRRNRLEPVALATAGDRLRAFVLEPWAALAADSEFLKKWSPGGPWLRLSDGDVADRVAEASPLGCTMAARWGHHRRARCVRDFRGL